MFISLLPTLVATYRVRENVHQVDQSRFDTMVRGSQRSLEQNVRNYLDSLVSIRSFFEASHQVDSVEWRRFLGTLELQNRYPNLALVAFVPRVTGAQKSTHEDNMRSLGLNGYQIRSSRHDKSEYYPVVEYFPADESHRKYQGLDVSDNVALREAMEKSTRSLRPELSGRVAWPELAQKAEDPYVAICLPIASPDGRKFPPTGYIVGLIRAGDLLESVVSRERDELIDLEVYDGAQATADKLLFDNDRHLHEAQAKVQTLRAFETERRVKVVGHDWTLHFSTLRGFEKGLQHFLPWLTLLGGLTISGALFGIALVEARGREVAERLTEDLRQAHERDRLVERATHDAIWDWDLQSNKVAWNEAAQTTLFYSLDKILPTLEWWEERLHPDDCERVSAGLKVAFSNGGEFWADEYRFLRGDGTYANLIDRGFIVRDKNGKPIRMIGSVMDITERIRVQEEKNRALRLSEVLVQNTPAVAVQLFDRTGKITLWNSASELFYGYKREEVLDKHMQDILLTPAEARVFEEVLEQIWKSLKPAEPFEWNVRSRDGTTKRVYSSMFPLVDGDKCTAVCCMDVDITARKQAEDALAAEKERLLVTLRSIGEGVIATDTKGNIVMMNRAAEQFTSVSHNAAIGMPLNEVFRAYDARTRSVKENPVKQVLEHEGVIEIMNQTGLLLSASRETHIAYSAAPIRHREGNVQGVVLVFRDITEEQRVMEERLRAGKLESLGILAGGIAHDFNNVLTVILGNLSVSKMSLPESHEMWQRVDESERAALRAKDLTQQLLTFAKGGAPVRRVASVVELIRESARFALSGSNVQCVTNFAEDLAMAEVDPGQIGQVIHNLVINAAQAMPDGGNIEIAAENLALDAGLENELPPGRYLKIVVKDCGRGIPPIHLARIFDPYFTTKKDGHGLGLATCYSIIKKHEGAIRVQSIVGVGTTFEVYLPASLAKTDTTIMQKREMRRGQGRILVMDDDVRIRDLATSMLKALGYDPSVACDGVEAMKIYADAKASGRPIAAIIMDLTIPGGMGGKETIKRMLALHPEVKAIVSSGYSNDPVMADHRAYGFVGVMAKPYKVEDLANLLHQVLS